MQPSPENLPGRFAICTSDFVDVQILQQFVDFSF